MNELSHSSVEKDLSAKSREFAVLREAESKYLPESIQKLTYRGRYDHLDVYTLQLIEISGYLKNRLSVLDIGAGVLPFGSPTDHDLFEKVALAGKQPDIIGVEPDLPQPLDPSHPEIQYIRSVNALPPAKQFDIVRMLRVVDWLNPEEYRTLRATVIKHIRPGGLFIAHQHLGFFNYTPPYDTFDPKITTTIKISQLRDGVVTPVSLLPDTKLPFTVLDPYEDIRTRVSRGECRVKVTLDTDGRQRVLQQLNEIGIVYLDAEEFDAQAMTLDASGWGSMSPTSLRANNAPPIEQVLSERTQEVAQWFHHGSINHTIE